MTSTIPRVRRSPSNGSTSPPCSARAATTSPRSTRRCAGWMRAATASAGPAASRWPPDVSPPARRPGTARAAQPRRLRQRGEGRDAEGRHDAPALRRLAAARLVITAHTCHAASQARPCRPGRATPELVAGLLLPLVTAGPGAYAHLVAFGVGEDPE